MANTLKEIKKVKEDEESPKDATPKKTNVGKSINMILGGSYIGKDKFYDNIPFLMFLMFLILCYISNTFYSDKIVSRLEKKTKEVELVRVEFVNTKAELMDYTKQSNIANLLDDYDINESRVPPKKIVVNKEKR